MNVCWTPTALEDLERIVDYIAERNLVAAIELHDLIQEKIDLLSHSSLMGRSGLVKGTRELVVHPHYVVVYDVANTVRVLRILHTSQQWSH
ncbi:type II toxin-antitoxin system RelE/ParE family toxin [Acinetobacter sp. ANC 4973]|uniref:type II toxin-antitoxin system RelE/ParE family toxin n=1 Tax=Acinetobacter sp. ANC 4973 TaxID=1977871 RepID=UPI000A351535|nr:type II toxin-antitoxin system RelE/ParE family toxin [Acinetobacter sp. ANC 4973]OTG97659.1 addiction module toxin RelE [Acinetobacter sp. ANC 4973]